MFKATIELFKEICEFIDEATDVFAPLILAILYAIAIGIAPFVR